MFTLTLVCKFYCLLLFLPTNIFIFTTMNRIKEILSEKNISQVELANRLNLPRASITQLLKTDNPRLDTLRAVADALNVPVWELLVSRDDIASSFFPDIYGSLVIGGVVHIIQSLDDFNELLMRIKNVVDEGDE